MNFPFSECHINYRPLTVRLLNGDPIVKCFVSLYRLAFNIVRICRPIFIDAAGMEPDPFCMQM